MEIEIPFFLKGKPPLHTQANQPSQPAVVATQVKSFSVYTFVRTTKHCKREWTGIRNSSCSSRLILLLLPHMMWMRMMMRWGTRARRPVSEPHSTTRGEEELNIYIYKMYGKERRKSATSSSCSLFFLSCEWLLLLLLMTTTTTLLYYTIESNICCIYSTDDDKECWTLHVSNFFPILLAGPFVVVFTVHTISPPLPSCYCCSITAGWPAIPHTLDGLN